MLEADGRCVKTTNTQVHTIVTTIRRCRIVAWRKYSADMKTPKAIPMAIENIIRNSTMYFIGMIEVTAASERRIADISNHDGHVGFDVMKP